MILQQQKPKTKQTKKDTCSRVHACTFGRFQMTTSRLNSTYFVV